MKTGKFQIGFGEADITPSGPVPVYGYYYERTSTGVHDRLCARSMAISDGEDRIVLCVADLVRVPDGMVAETRRLVQRHCGLRPENLILSAVHTHTGPDVTRESSYTASVAPLLIESVRLALKDLSPCELNLAYGEDPGVQFIRRYRMKDGSVMTNPGILNPDVVEPMGTVDPALAVLLASGDGRTRGGLVHLGLHCDTVGGTELSADWTYYLRERMRQKLGGDLALLTPVGPQGDVNHWNVFADVSLRGFAEAERIGSRIADAALRAVPKAQPVRPGRICGLQQEVEISIRMPSDAELAEARRVLSEPPPEGVDFTMERVEAMRSVRAAEVGSIAMHDISVLTFGDVALVGLPCEPFTELGRSIKFGSPFEHTLVIALAHGTVLYVGAKHHYGEGGYEMTTAITVPGTGERMVDVALELLRKAKRRRE